MKKAPLITGENRLEDVDPVDPPRIPCPFAQVETKEAAGLDSKMLEALKMSDMRF